jgi:hypothetical protein
MAGMAGGAFRAPHVKNIYFFWAPEPKRPLCKANARNRTIAGRNDVKLKSRFGWERSLPIASLQDCANILSVSRDRTNRSPPPIHFKTSSDFLDGARKIF